MLELQARREDNGKELRCEATNPALEGNLVDSTTIRIECKLHTPECGMTRQEACACGRCRRSRLRLICRLPSSSLSGRRRSIISFFLSSYDLSTRLVYYLASFVFFYSFEVESL